MLIEPQARVSVAMPVLDRQQCMHYALVQGLYWAIMFGMGECYFSIFAAHLHAPRFYFGLMTGVPSLLGPVSQLFGADSVERTGKRKKIVSISVLMQCLCFVPLAWLPFLDAGPSSHTMLLVIVMFYFVTAHYCVPAWNSWISVIVPSDERSKWFAMNSRAAGVVSLVAKLAVAVALYYSSRQSEGVEAHYAVLIFAASFALSGIARFGSFIYMRKMYEPIYVHPPEASFTFWQFIRRTRESNFVRFVLFVSLVYFSTLIAGPFFVPYAIYTLKFESWQWVVLESFGALSSIATLYFWGSFSHRFGNKKTLQYTSALIALIPMFWVVSVNFYVLTAVNVISGMAWAGFNLSAFNYLLEAVSPPKRARCVAYFNYLVGIGSFCGSMLGAYLYEVLPTTLHVGDQTIIVSSPFIYLLVLSAVGRLMMSAFFAGTFTELRQVEPFALKDLTFYVSEMLTPVGLRFGAISDPPDESDTRESDSESSK